MIEEYDRSSPDCGWLGWLLVSAYYVIAVSASLSGLILHYFLSSDTSFLVLWVGALAVPFVHGLFIVAIKAAVQNYVHLSVEPGWIFMLADLVQGGVFGASVVGYFCNSKHLILPIAANGMLVACSSAMVYKNVVLTWDTYHRRRNSLTGAPLIRRKRVASPQQPLPLVKPQVRPPPVPPPVPPQPQVQPPDLQSFAWQPMQFQTLPLQSFPLRHYAYR
tara:strand:- start:7011 stop:7667 length:657 start_codon:yes stop_codon:yes gene_type:complete